jgi:hypothetical protein
MRSLALAIDSDGAHVSGVLPALRADHAYYRDSLRAANVRSPLGAPHLNLRNSACPATASPAAKVGVEVKGFETDSGASGELGAGIGARSSVSHVEGRDGYAHPLYYLSGISKG